MSKNWSPLIVLGTRPEAIKMAPIFRAMTSHSHFTPRLCVIGQHSDLIAPMIKLFGMKPDYTLTITRSKPGLLMLTAEILASMHDWIHDIPCHDGVIVQGDTTAAFCTALAAYYQQVPVFHVEAGLRSYNKNEPMPEEVNRRAITSMADLHFAPSARARENLLSEHIPKAHIHLTGNTVIDAMQWVFSTQLDPFQDETHPLYSLVHKPYILLTAHRREHWGDRHKEYFKALNRVALSQPEVSILFPIHSNPVVQQAAAESFSAPNAHLIAAQDYVSFCYLMKYARLIVTDSGGIQEEVTTLGTPTLTIRNVTERMEAIENGPVQLISKEALYSEVLKLLRDDTYYASRSIVSYPYGDGTAGEKITQVIDQWLSSRV